MKKSTLLAITLSTFFAQAALADQKNDEQIAKIIKGDHPCDAKQYDFKINGVKIGGKLAGCNLRIDWLHGANSFFNYCYQIKFKEAQKIPLKTELHSYSDRQRVESPVELAYIHTPGLDMPHSFPTAKNSIYLIAQDDSPSFSEMEICVPPSLVDAQALADALRASTGGSGSEKASNSGSATVN